MSLAPSSYIMAKPLLSHLIAWFALDPKLSTGGGLRSTWKLGLLGVPVELEMQVKKIRNENSVLLQEAVEPHYIRYIVAKD